MITPESRHLWAARTEPANGDPATYGDSYHGRVIAWHAPNPERPALVPLVYMDGDRDAGPLPSDAWLLALHDTEDDAEHDAEQRQTRTDRFREQLAQQNTTTPPTLHLVPRKPAPARPRLVGDGAERCAPARPVVGSTAADGPHTHRSHTAADLRGQGGQRIGNPSGARGRGPDGPDGAWSDVFAVVAHWGAGGMAEDLAAIAAEHGGLPDVAERARLALVALASAVAPTASVNAPLVWRAEACPMCQRRRGPVDQ